MAFSLEMAIWASMESLPFWGAGAEIVGDSAKPAARFNACTGQGSVALIRFVSPLSKVVAAPRLEGPAEARLTEHRLP